MKPNRKTFLLGSSIGICMAFTLAPISEPARAQNHSAIEPEQPGIAIALGSEHISAGDVNFGGKYDFTQLTASFVGTNQQHNGDFDGLRTDAALIVPARLFSWQPGLMGFRGFYSRHDEGSAFNCVSAILTASCDGAPLFDPDPTANNTLGTGPDEIVTYGIDRELRHWGTSLDIAPGEARMGDIQQRFGVGYRAIDQTMDLTSTWSASTNSQHYAERLDTRYLGIYWGLNGRRELGHGLELVFAGEAGIYAARSDYRGTLTQSDFTGDFSQSLSLDRDETAFIGAVNLALEKQFQSFTLAGFVRGEYYSYAPQMAYNQTDRATALVPDIDFMTGPNHGTRIDDTEAWSVTVGGALSIPLGFER